MLAAALSDAGNDVSWAFVAEIVGADAPVAIHRFAHFTSADFIAIGLDFAGLALFEGGDVAFRVTDFTMVAV